MPDFWLGALDGFLECKTEFTLNKEEPGQFQARVDAMLEPLYLLTDDDVKTHPIGKVYRWFGRNLQRRGTISFEQIHAK